MTGPTEIEIVYRHDDGREEVRYRRPYPSASAETLIEEVHARQKHGRENDYESPYFWRYSGVDLPR